MDGTEIPIDGRDYPISEVTIYRSDRAIVQRRIPINVKSGQNSIVIDCLSSVLDEDSIRVKAETTSHSQVLTIFDVVYSAPTTHTYVRPKPSTPEIKALEEEKAALRVRVKAVERQHALLKEYSHSLRAGRIQGLATEHLVSFMDMSLEKDVELWEKKRNLEKDIKSLEEKIANIGVKEEIVLPMLRSGVTVILVAQEASPIELMLSYGATAINCYTGIVV